MKSYQKRLVTIAVGAIMTPVAAYAQLEEVLVTAQKREQNLQDVPISISSVNEAMISQTDATEITDLIPFVPGLTGSSYGISTNTWAIRGISSNDWTIGSEPAVGVFFDDAYIGRNYFATGAFHDVQRIEVVKGPQGTLFGRNAAAGAISIVSNKPSNQNELNLGVQAGDEGQRRYTVVGNWAATDSLAFRASYQGKRFEGLWEEVVNDEDAFNDSDVARFMARWNPSDSVEATLAVRYSKAESNYNSAHSTALNTAEPGVEFPDKYALTATNTPNRSEVESDGVGLNISWEITDSLLLTSITDIRSATSEYREDVDGSADDAAIDAAFGGITGGVTLFFDQEVKADTYYQELRLNGGDDTFEWFGGLSFYREELDLDKWDSPLIDTALGLGIVANSQVRNSAENDSYGVYGDATWHMSEAFSVTGGVRWSQDKKDWCTNTLIDELGAYGGPTNGQLCSNEEWDEWTPRLVLQYNVTDDAMLFASVARGYKGGGFNVAASDTNGDGFGDTIVPFDPETSYAYELGVKTSLLNGQMQLNGSAFYTDYEDFQLQTATIGGIIISNEGEAVTQGLELELNYAPTDGLTLMGNYAYLDAEFSDGVLDGNDLAYAPENTFATAVDFKHDLFTGTLNWFAIYTYTDDFFFDGANDLKEDSYGLLDGKVTYTGASGKWDIALAADNITDEDYAIIRLDLGLGTGANMLQGYGRLVRAEVNFRL